jgi:hypothetical protein
MVVFGAIGIVAIEATGAVSHAQDLRGKDNAIASEYVADSAEALGEIYGIFKTCNPANAFHFDQSRLMQMMRDFAPQMQKLAMAEWGRGRSRGVEIQCREARARTQVLIARVKHDSEGLKSLGKQAH